MQKSYTQKVFTQFILSLEPVKDARYYNIKLKGNPVHLAQNLESMYTSRKLVSLILKSENDCYDFIIISNLLKGQLTEEFSHWFFDYHMTEHDTSEFITELLNKAPDQLWHSDYNYCSKIDLNLDLLIS